MSNPPEQFQDPELKAAIVRLRGGHTAGAELREKLMRRLAENRQTESSNDGFENAAGDPSSPMKISPAPRRSKVSFFRSPTFLAMAASILIVLVGGSVYVRILHERHEAEERQEYFDLNRDILTAMVGAHEGGCGKQVDHQTFANAASDPRATAIQLTHQLGRPVPAPNFKGWKIENASVCQVGTVSAAHWQLSRNGQHISLLSLPVSSFKTSDDYDNYEFVLDQHAIAGYVRSGGVNCVICDPSISESQATQLRDELKRG